MKIFSQNSLVGRLIAGAVVASMCTAIVTITRPASAQTPGVPLTTEVAIANERFVNVYPSDTSTEVAARLDAKQNFSNRLVFRVVDSSGKRLKVQLVMRPNEVTGYIDRQGTTIKVRDYYVRVDLSEHKLTLYKAGVEVFSDKVAVGKKDTPTPTGNFFLAELAKVKNKGSEYGPWAFGLSAFSNKITHFKNRGGQIGLHGTNKPKDLGKDVSHGCIRISNASISKLAETVPQGTPIEIIA